MDIAHFYVQSAGAAAASRSTGRFSDLQDTIAAALGASAGTNDSCRRHPAPARSIRNFAQWSLAYQAFSALLGSVFPEVLPRLVAHGRIVAEYASLFATSGDADNGTGNFELAAIYDRSARAHAGSDLSNFGLPDTRAQQEVTFAQQLASQRLAARAKAGRGTTGTTKKTREEVKDEICKKFLKNRCPYGNECWRRHERPTNPGAPTSSQPTKGGPTASKP